MARQRAKRNLVKRPGLLEAAAALGCNYSHLRRVVIGARPSKSLMARYRALKSSLPNQTATRPRGAEAARRASMATPLPMKTNLPQKSAQTAPDRCAAAENLTPVLFNILAKLGLDVLVVQFQAGPASPIWQHAGIEQVLHDELQAAQAGQYDSEVYVPGSRWFFFHVNDLGKAMQTIKTCLAARGLLEITILLHAETAQDLRVYYPATAECISTKADTEA